MRTATAADLRCQWWEPTDGRCPNVAGDRRCKGKFLCPHHRDMAVNMSAALVVQEAARCPRCGERLHRETITVQPLLRHGGYGAAQRSVRESCRCGWGLVVDVSEERPTR